MDLLCTNATLLTMRGDRLGIVDDGVLAVRGDRIAYAGPGDEPDAPSPKAAAELRDCSGKVVLPGLVNAHTHTGMTLLRGLAQDVPEIEWMNQALGPFAAELTREDRVAGARLGVLEALRAGATTVTEYASEVEALVDAVYGPLGLHCVAVETINEVPDDRSDADPREPYPFDREQGEAALARAESLFDVYGDDPLVTPAYGPQALDMVSPGLLETVRDRAAERDAARLHVHVAQGERERLQVEARYGEAAATVSTLDDLGLLGPNLVAVHCHGASAAERERLAESGAAMLGCPSSIAAIDGEVAPVASFRAHGAPVGLGTDQAPGPGHHDVLREARTAATLSKVERGDPTALSAAQALRLVTVEGARALGVADEVGTLEAGTRADFVVADPAGLGTAPALRDPLHTVVPNLVYGAGSQAVEDVYVAGEPLVADGAFVDADPEAAVEAATDRAEAVVERAGEAWRAADSDLVTQAENGWL